jgi:hypothetical protein
MCDVVNLLRFADILLLNTASESAFTSVLYGCHLSFKFICEILINKFEIHNLQVHLWNLIKHLAIPLCIST